MILAVESRTAGEEALRQAEESQPRSYPHLSPGRRAELERHLLGFVVWEEIVSRFDLPPEALLDTHTSERPPQP